jgi:dTDP-glucose 4,6-dehydratase
MHKIVVTGGAGFIGSHVAERIVAEYPDAELAILDKMTYAADIENIAHLLRRGQRRLFVGDLCDLDFCTKVTLDADLVLHLAAESHVDNSFGNSLRFTQSNALGTHTLLEACRVNQVGKFVHVSTDEVYGQIYEGLHVESDVLDPTNPYSASKAAADMIVKGYIRSFKMPIVTVRANNIYGIRQYPEKLIPRFTLLCLSGQKLPLHGDGRHRRRFLAAEDFAEALIVLIKKGVIGEIYNVGSDAEYSNIEIAEMIAFRLNRPSEDLFIFVEDRLFNDARYAIDSTKIHALGWAPIRPLERHLGEVIKWYEKNADRYAHLLEAAPVER